MNWRQLVPSMNGTCLTPFIVRKVRVCRCMKKNTRTLDVAVPVSAINGIPHVMETRVVHKDKVHLVDVRVEVTHLRIAAKDGIRHAYPCVVSLGVFVVARRHYHHAVPTLRKRLRERTIAMQAGSRHQLQISLLLLH